MIEVPAYPGDSWQPVTCRLCFHHFAVLVTDLAAEPVGLCQACTLFVEVLGQRAILAPTPRPTPPASAQTQPSVAPLSSAPASPAPLSAVWTQWWTRWRESQEETAPPGGAPLQAPEAEAGC